MEQILTIIWAGVVAKFLWDMWNKGSNIKSGFGELDCSEEDFYWSLGVDKSTFSLFLRCGPGDRLATHAHEYKYRLSGEGFQIRLVNKTFEGAGIRKESDVLDGVVQEASIRRRAEDVNLNPIARNAKEELAELESLVKWHEFPFGIKAKAFLMSFQEKSQI